MGFTLTPLTADGNLDTSLDFKGGPHPVAQDPLYRMACENRDTGNKLVKEAQYEPAVAQYSELIVKTRTLEGEQDVIWTDDARVQVRQLRATAYLNLSLCFLKLEQWTHASNTATRAMQGDKDPPDPKEDVLADDKKAKALFRRATAQIEGFGNFDKGLADLRKAKEYAPEDKAIEQMLRKCNYAVKKTEKKADKKMSGFLKKEAASGDGLFDDSLRPTEADLKKVPELKEPKMLSEGLWVVPKEQEDAARDAVRQLVASEKLGPLASASDAPSDSAEGAEGAKVDLAKLHATLEAIKESNPQLYEDLRHEVNTCLHERADQYEAELAKEAKEGLLPEGSESAPPAESAPAADTA